MVPAAHAAKDDDESIVVEDPHYGEILFYFYQEDYFPAIVRLLAAQEQRSWMIHADEAELLLGGMYLVLWPASGSRRDFRALCWQTMFSRNS